jgi:mannose-1-phosphate guanylyltransferase/mannose-6-phosphate isomerase
LCGGAGTRLWPVSREQYPKQLLPVAGSQSLLQQTALRLKGSGFAPPIVVSGEEHRFFVKRQLDASGAAPEIILLEPEGRNTAAAAGLAAAWLESTDRDELMLVVPSDHVIGNRQAFVDALVIALPHAEQGAIVTFGAQPTQPNTQYGYIEAAADRPIGDGALPITRFHEKPDAATAARYVESGRFYWNCGIFLAKASAFLDAMRTFLPASVEAITRSIEGATRDGIFLRPHAGAFTNAEKISIDHGIMERTSAGVVVPVQMGWSDVGSWDAVWSLSPKDEENNAVQGSVVALDTRDSLLRNEGKAVLATLGVEKMAVIAVPDAVFVAPIDRVSEVKRIVDELKGKTPDRVTEPARVARPWGSYEVIAAGPGFQVKHIVVDPGEALSLQLHQQRSEHWIVVRGSAEVTVGDEVSSLEEQQSTFIPAGIKHRLANRGELPLELVEVQSGAYLGEDDIVRFEDCYGRVDD